MLPCPVRSDEAMNTLVVVRSFRVQKHVHELLDAGECAADSQAELPHGRRDVAVLHSAADVLAIPAPALDTRSSRGQQSGPRSQPHEALRRVLHGVLNLPVVAIRPPKSSRESSQQGRALLPGGRKRGCRQCAQCRAEQCSSWHCLMSEQ